MEIEEYRNKMICFYLGKVNVACGKIEKFEQHKFKKSVPDKSLYKNPDGYHVSYSFEFWSPITLDSVQYDTISVEGESTCYHGKPIIGLNLRNTKFTSHNSINLIKFIRDCEFDCKCEFKMD